MTSRLLPLFWEEDDGASLILDPPLVLLKLTCFFKPILIDVPKIKLKDGCTKENLE